MLAEVLRLVLGYHVVQGVGEEGEESVVLGVDGVGEAAVLVRGHVVVVYVEGGKLVDTHVVNLGDVEPVRGPARGRLLPRGHRVLDIPEMARLVSAH